MASLESRSRRGIVRYGRPAAGNPQRDVHLVKYSLQHQNPVFRVRQRYLTSQSIYCKDVVQHEFILWPSLTVKLCQDKT